MPCPNECGRSPKLGALDDHIANECPLQLIECAFEYAGCNEKLHRKDMPDHITQSLALHMSLQATSLQQELKGHITEMETQLNRSTELQRQSAAEIVELRKLNQVLLENQDKSAAEIADLQIKNQLLQEKLDQEC